MAFSQKMSDAFLIGVKSQIVTDLRLYLEREDMVILIESSGAGLMLEMLCKSNAFYNTSKRVVIISTEEFPQKLCKHIYCTVSEVEMQILLNIYRSYEVSDKLILLSREINYGSTWNYVNSGLISEEEIFDVMFM